MEVMALAATWVDIDEGNWEKEVAKADRLVVVDFWATWCPYCRRLMPIFDELSKEYSAKMRFAKLDVDKARGIAARFGITGIPVLKFFCEGREVGELIGYRPKEALKVAFDQALATYKTCIQSSTPMYA